MKYHKDGSLILYIQNEKPSEDKIGNWLQAPKDTMLSGAWQPSAVVKVK